MELDYERKVGLAAERLKLWGDTFTLLAEHDVAAKLIAVLEEGDRMGLEALLEPVGLFQTGECIDIVETITKVINFGPGHPEERCQLVYRIFFNPPSDTKLEQYQLPDGTFMSITEREWLDYFERAERDPAWRDANRPFLKALGILKCAMVNVPDDAVITINKTKRICPPFLVSP
jgi:hypothetical protein